MAPPREPARPVYLAASACVRDAARLAQEAPELWRRVRRFNLPVQLALAAAERVAARARDPRAAALVSVAPCRPGSVELWSWAHEHVGREQLARVRLNPLYTLHIVDNLALSAFALAHGNQGWCLGVGGAAGQAWVALEAAWERVAEGHEDEALLLAGEVEANDEARGAGVALLLDARPAVWQPAGRAVRVERVTRTARVVPDGDGCRPHSTAGLEALLAALAAAGDTSRGVYAVPPEHGDGLDAVQVAFSGACAQPAPARADGVRAAAEV